MFSKDTDTHMYLNFRSSHQKHIKINIPFNLSLRIITITNTEELRDTRLRELRLYLKNQQYPEEIVEHVFIIFFFLQYIFHTFATV
jgi:hypothetical protein